MKRADLLKSLEEVVRASAKHESSVYQSVIALRRSFDNAAGRELEKINEYLKAEQSFIKSLRSIREAYPQLQAEVNFKAYAKTLRKLEDEIAMIRKSYNDAATAYNTRIRQFPDMFLAAIGKFRTICLISTTSPDVKI